MSNKGLGKGLDALLPQESSSEKQGLKKVPVDRIEPDPDQPRKRFDEEQLEELTRSIENQGLIEPVILRPGSQNNSFRLVAGERRWRASCQAGLETIPAIVRELDNKEALAISLVENIQRSNLTPVEEARAYRRLMDQQEWGQSQLAEHVGKSRSAVANRLRLLNLPEPVLNALEENEISAGHARALLSLDEEPQILDMLDKILLKGWSVRETEENVKKTQNETEDDDDTESPSNPPATSRDYGPAEATLEEAIGASVSIETKNHREGYIRIYFSNPDEFEALQNRLRNLENQ